MAAGITNRLWSLEDIVAKIDAMAPAAKVRGPYKKKGKEHAISGNVEDFRRCANVDLYESVRGD